MTDYGWVLEAPVYVRVHVTPTGTGDTVTVKTLDAGAVAVLKYDGHGRYLTNGEDYDYGDDFPAVLGLIDCAYERPGEWVFLAAANYGPDGVL